MIALCFGGLILLDHALPEFGTGWNLATKAVTTKGVVVQRMRVSPSKYTSPFKIEYRFQANRTYTDWAETSESNWIRYKPGTPITVWYLPDQPDTHDLARGTRLWLGLFGLLGACLFVCVGAMGSLAAIVRVGQTAFLRSVGLRQTATVIRIKRGRGDYMTQSWTLIWKDETGRFGVSNQQMVLFHSREPPPIGSTITIYADPTGKLPPVWEGDVGARDGGIS
jgi:hypothetical protein